MCQQVFYYIVNAPDDIKFLDFLLNIIYLAKNVKRGVEERFIAEKFEKLSNKYEQFPTVPTSSQQLLLVPNSSQQLLKVPCSSQQLP